MKSIYFLITHYDADQAALLGMRLLNLYRPRFYQDLLDVNIILLTTGTTLKPGCGEDVFLRIPNAGHHEGDLEMLNAGVATALARGADVIVKLSQTRLFLNGRKLHGLVRMLLKSGKGAMGDHWCDRHQVSTDVLLIKKDFANRLFPLPVAHGSVFAERFLGDEIRKKGLWSELLIHNYRQPIHDQEGRRRTRFYESLELATNHNQSLRNFIVKHYPRYQGLLADPDSGLSGRLHRYDFESLKMTRNPAFVLKQRGERYELLVPGSDETHQLNPPAALVLISCEPHATVGDIKRNIASEFGLPAIDIHADVQEILEEFLDRHFIRVLLPDEDAADHDDSISCLDSFDLNVTPEFQRGSDAPTTYRDHLRLVGQELEGPHYTTILKDIHERLKPSTYVEIGVESGHTLSLAEPPTLCIGIDPEPNIRAELRAPSKVFSRTSDEFFAEFDIVRELNNQKIALAFIDGLHRFEAVLNDFINIERSCTRDSMVILHDSIPFDRLTSNRKRATDFWTGDVWKIIPCLQRCRPDLEIITIPATPSGLTIITGLDPGSASLSERLDEIISEFGPLPYSYLEKDKRQRLCVTSNWQGALERLLSTKLRDDDDAISEQSAPTKAVHVDSI